MTWKREKKDSFDPFLPLSGEKGAVTLIFLGDPEETESNIQPGKTEYHFPAYKGTLDPNVGRMLWEKVIVTESGDNFLAALTEHQEARGWEKAVHVQWTMKQSKKGRKFKDFHITPIQPPNWPEAMSVA